MGGFRTATGGRRLADGRIVGPVEGDDKLLSGVVVMKSTFEMVQACKRNTIGSDMPWPSSGLGKIGVERRIQRHAFID